MKNRLFFLLCFFVIFLMASCSLIGNISKDSIFTPKNHHAYLLTKKPLDFDKQLGYEVSIYELSKDSSKIAMNKVYIYESVWKILPEPSNTILVDIEYVESTDLGESNNPDFVIRYSEFNICVGYTVYTKKIK